MKKLVSFILLLCMVLLLSACGKVEITMQEIYDASQTEVLLKNHQSVYIRDEFDGEFFSEKYLTREYSYDHIHNEEFEWAEFMTDNASYCFSDGDYVRFLPITPDGLTNDCASLRAESYASVIMSTDTIDETIESASKKDSRITVKTVLSQQLIEAMAEDGIVSGKFEYVLDAKTREFISIIGDYNYEDGTADHLSSEVSYDIDAPEKIKTFLEFENQTENLRNITVVSNPGTEREVSQSIQVPKELILGFRYDEDTTYEFEPYVDAACTEVYDPYADTESDLTIYVKWTE